jgi:hypothetical protein
MLTVRAVILYSQLPHLNRGDWEAFERVVYSCVTGMPPTHVHTHSHSHARARTHTRTHCYPDARPPARAEHVPRQEWRSSLSYLSP